MCVDAAAAATPGTRADLVDQPLLKRDPLLNRAGRRPGDPEAQTATVPSCSKPASTSVRFRKLRTNSNGRDDQDQRHRDLADNQPTLKSGAMAIDGHAARRLAHGGDRIHERHAQRGDEAEEHRRERRTRADERRSAASRPRDSASHGLVVVSRKAISARPDSSATGTASAAPPTATSRLSISSSEDTRERDAPTATRTAISRSRALARASVSVARLAHVIRSTSAVSPNSSDERRAVRRRAAADAASGGNDAKSKGAILRRSDRRHSPTAPWRREARAQRAQIGIGPRDRPVRLQPAHHRQPPEVAAIETVAPEGRRAHRQRDVERLADFEAR